MAAIHSVSTHSANAATNTTYSANSNQSKIATIQEKIDKLLEEIQEIFEAEMDDQAKMQLLAVKQNMISVYESQIATLQYESSKKMQINQDDVVALTDKGRQAQEADRTDEPTVVKQNDSDTLYDKLTLKMDDQDEKSGKMAFFMEQQEENVSLINEYI